MLGQMILSFALLLGSLGLLTLFWILPTRYSQPAKHESKHSSGLGKLPQVSVQIVVLGDIGHSPRMQNHALSIAKHGGCVSIIGYQSSIPSSELLANPLISLVPLPAPPGCFQTKRNILFPFFGILKVLHQVWSLWFALAYRSKAARWMIVQNPPSVPTLGIAQVVCRLRNTQLIVDWHNFGYSILALKLGDKHPMVKLMAYHERRSCHFATVHFCVSNAMARILRDDMNIRNPVIVLHDRPPVIFKPIKNHRDRFSFLSALPETSSHAQDIMDGKCQLLVSSTSWTPDEDFSLLIAALCRYSQLANSSNSTLPSICVVITGKGPEKEMYLAEIRSLEAAGKLAKVAIKTAWLSFEEYARLLACASLGVSLHTSSSGVDLPMKVVDMFGAGLPVVGWDKYEAWPELVKEGLNGRGFGSADDLLADLVELFGENTADLQKLREGALLESNHRWDETWDTTAKDLLGL